MACDYCPKIILCQTNTEESERIAYPIQRDALSDKVDIGAAWILLVHRMMISKRIVSEAETHRWGHDLQPCLNGFWEWSWFLTKLVIWSR